MNYSLSPLGMLFFGTIFVLTFSKHSDIFNYFKYIGKHIKYASKILFIEKWGSGRVSKRFTQAKLFSTVCLLGTCKKPQRPPERRSRLLPLLTLNIKTILRPGPYNQDYLTAISASTSQSEFKHTVWHSRFSEGLIYPTKVMSGFIFFWHRCKDWLAKY